MRHAERGGSVSGSNSEAVSTLRRYLQQRLDTGEKMALRVRTQPRGVAKSEPAASVTTSPAATITTSPAASVTTSPAASITTSHAAKRSIEQHAAASLENDSLARVAAEVRACTACRLHATRTNAVPGVGPDGAAVLFVGEGPGADEDAKGEPFVGRAGQLLTKIIESVQMKREDVFITNIVKCRPPGNRDPEPDEIAACRPFLERQVRLLQPRVICTLGRHAASTLLGKQESMARLRTERHTYAEIPVFPTYHPAALLRNPQWKRPVWEDIQKVRRACDGAD